MSVTGVLGHTWRADVTPAGSVVPWDGSGPLDWYIAADDRWHEPQTDTGVRHLRVSGTAVFETKVRVPGGDAVQRVWSVAAAGGYTLVEVLNDSPLPMAIAFTRNDVVTSRPPTDVPVQGIDLPAGTVVLPVGHRTSVTVGLPHGKSGSLPPGLPPADAVVRGWVTRVETASRLDLPDPTSVDAVRAARCELLLTGPARPDDDPERYLLGLAELVRLGDVDARAAADYVPTVAAAVGTVAAGSSPLAAAALDAAAGVLAAADEPRALRDLARIKISTGKSGHFCPDLPVGMGSWGVETVALVERTVAAGPVLFPGGLPPSWLGVDFEAHGLVAGPASRLSLAVRWHGANPAVLWDVAGEPVTLTSPVVAPGWITGEGRGDTLWILDETVTHGLL